MRVPCLDRANLPPGYGLHLGARVPVVPQFATPATEILAILDLIQQAKDQLNAITGVPLGELHMQPDFLSEIESRIWDMTGRPRYLPGHCGPHGDEEER